MSTLGERLKDLRKKSKMTQGDLSTLAGVSKTTISFWESGTYNLTEYEHVMLMSKIFKVSHEYIYYGTEGENSLKLYSCPLIKFENNEKIIIKDITTFEPYPPETFFAIVQDESMSSKFSEYRLFSKGDMVLIYPSLQPKDADYVLARHRGKDIVAVRYYLAQGGIVLLRVGNSIFESLNGNLDTYEILGVVKQQIVRYLWIVVFYP